MDNLEVDVLRRLAVELLRRQPARLCRFGKWGNGCTWSTTAWSRSISTNCRWYSRLVQLWVMSCYANTRRKQMLLQNENGMHVKNSSFSATCFGRQCSGFSYEVSGRCPCDGASSEQWELPTYCISAVCFMAAWPFRLGQSKSCTKLLRHCHQDKISFT